MSEKVESTEQNRLQGSRPMELMVHSGGGWSGPRPLGSEWQGTTPAALASYQGRLYAAFVRGEPNDQMVVTGALDISGRGAPSPEQIQEPHADASLQSRCAPALGVAAGKLYLAVTGIDDLLYVRTKTTGGGWSSPAMRVGDSLTRTGVAPSLGMFQDQLWMTWVRGGDAFVHVYDGSRWLGPYKSDALSSTSSPVAMANWGGYIWRVLRKSSNSTVWVNRNSARPPRWEGGGGLHTWTVPNGMALAPYNNQLWLLMRDTNGFLRAAYYSGSSWTEPHLVGGNNPIRLMDEPAAALHDGKLYVMYRRG